MDFFGTSLDLPYVPKDTKNYLFFKKIYRKIGLDFMGADLRKKRTEIEELFNESKERYFEKQILMDAVFRCIGDLDSTAATHPLHLNALKLHTKESSEISKEFQLLGINEKSISKLIEIKKNLKETPHTQRLTKLVENYITEFCRKILDFSGHSDVSDNDLNMFEKVMNLISSKATLLSAGRAVLHPKETDVENMLLTYYKELSEGLSLLRELLALEKQRLEFQLTLAESNHIRANAFNVKLREMEHLVMEATYTEEAVQALNIIKTELDEKEESLLEQKVDKREFLQAYKILGKRFDELAREYSNLTEEIRKIEWTIETLEEDEDN